VVWLRISSTTTPSPTPRLIGKDSNGSDERVRSLLPNGPFGATYAFSLRPLSGALLPFQLLVAQSS